MVWRPVELSEVCPDSLFAAQEVVETIETTGSDKERVNDSDDNPRLNELINVSPGLSPSWQQRHR